MADINVTTVIVGLISAAVGWLFKTTIQLGKDFVELRTAFRYYLERTGKDSAMVLNSPNPTPPEIRELLQRHIAGRWLDDKERERLAAYLRELRNDFTAPKSERNAAIQLLAAMETLKMVAKRGH